MFNQRAIDAQNNPLFQQVVDHVPEIYRGIANDIVNSLSGLYSSDVIIELIRALINGTIISSNLPFGLKILANTITNFVANKGSEIWKKKLYQELYEQGDKAKLESQNKQKIRPVLPGVAPEDRSQIFPGFQQLTHTALIGSTNSGKTTWLTTKMLQNGVIPEFDIFVLIGSDYMNNENIQPIRKAVMYHLKETEKPFDNNVFFYFKASEIQDAIAFASSSYTDKQKLMFFDDIQISNHASAMGNFSQQAKNHKCTLFISMHVAFSKQTDIMIRGACRYYVLFNQNENTFNRLTDQRVGNALWRQYNLITDKYERVIIYDTETKKAYAGVNKMHLLNPLINNINTDNHGDEIKDDKTSKVDENINLSLR